MTSTILDLSSIDKSVSPADDFYGYSVGRWVEQAKIPADKAEWNFFVEQSETNLQRLREIIEAAGRNPDSKSEAYKFGLLYSLAIDETGVEKDGLKPLKAEFERIEKIAHLSQLARELAHLHLHTSSPFFSFGPSQDPKNSALMIGDLSQGGLTLPDRDYYLDKEQQPIRDKYFIHLKKIFGLLGEDKERAEQDAKTVIKIETELAKVSMTKVDLRDPLKSFHKMSVKQLDKLAPAIAWEEYFADLGLPKQKTLNVGQPEFFKGLDRTLKRFSVAEIKTYLRWQLVAAMSPYLTKPFVDANFDFFQRTFMGLQAQPPRWKRMVGAVNGLMGEAVGKVYVKKYFPPASKAKMLALVRNILAATRQRLQNVDWMEAATRREALKKLAGITVKIGYPDKWIDYSKLEIKKDTFIANIMRANYFNARRELAEIGRPTDRKKWYMPPQTVNAYYAPPNNEIVFPAAILQPVMFNPEADEAVNYGAIGAVIAHEITHGFDDQGRKYDSRGNLRDWWTKNDDRRFRARAQLLVKQYSQYVAVDKEHLNGELTLGENIADLGGLNISLTALKFSLKGKKAGKLDGLTPTQRFFHSFAQAWRDKIRPEYLKLRVKVDLHSPPRYRVNGPLANMPEFAAAFNVPAGALMALPASKRTKIW